MTTKILLIFCGGPQIFDNLNQPLIKQKSALYVLLRPRVMLDFFWIFRVGYNEHNQPARVLLLLIKLLINGHRIFLKVELNWYNRIG